jgi:hypothetical protein
MTSQTLWLNPRAVTISILENSAKIYVSAGATALLYTASTSLTITPKTITLDNLVTSAMFVPSASLNQKNLMSLSWNVKVGTTSIFPL